MRSVLVLILATAMFAGVKGGEVAKSSSLTNEQLLQQYQELVSKLLTELNKKNQQPQMYQPQPQLPPQPPPKPQFNWRPADFQWVSWAANSKIPQRAILAGHNWNQGELYVARVRHNGQDYVAKASVKDRKCYLAYEGTEIRFDRCEVLTGSGLSWVFTSNGDLPGNAFACGTKANGEPQLIGRVDHPWPGVPISRTPGTIDVDSGLLSISFAGSEYRYSNYDVLVVS